MPIKFDEYNDGFQKVSNQMKKINMSNEELNEWKAWAEEWIEEEKNKKCTNTKQDSSES